MLVSVDPGTDCCGLALWRDAGTLQHASLVRCPDYTPGPQGRAYMARAVADAVAAYANGDHVNLVIEFPRTYGGQARKGDANDLIALAATVGAIQTAVNTCAVREVSPPEWKGQLPKPKRASDPYVVQLRAISRLSSTERQRVEWPANKRLQWDVADAIGIGLHALKRWSI